MTRDQLLEELIDEHSLPLGDQLASWLASRRFAAFVDEHLPKVRKKLRTAPDEESLRDLLLELEIGYRLTQDKRFSLTYEPVQQRNRGADFAVRFTSRPQFMLEVTRLRDAAGAELDAARFAGVLALKLGQFSVAHANVLVIGVDREPPANERLAAMLTTVRQRAESVEQSDFKKQGFRDRGDYLGGLRRLNAVVIKRAPVLALTSAAAASVSTTWSR